ncbi:hypothetical protein Poli38472_001156 [Pythium oligandrum]|uniref:Uncharacterized protein n=1 Tax=Pythium oligandrum TaxID=41045 RepID=A0A8K1FM59_PYTOL|nr:hypothetical protein Poli38472_001156 [Pythium oligandrum]|eukprot:TMW69000.1 hypothetical protein Poli38472_001156 [Pythium oligandrum]
MTSGKYATFATDAPLSPSPRHPLSQAGLFSRVFLGWASPLLRLGNSKQLNADDVWSLQPAHQAGTIAKSFSSNLEASPSILRAFLRSFGGRVVLTGLAFLTATGATLVGPLVLNHVVNTLSTETYDVSDLSKWIGGLLLTLVVQALADNYANFDTEVIAIQFTGALKNLIYHKTLKLSAASRLQYSTGDITSLYTTDCQFLLDAAFYIHQFWLMPLQVICVSVLLYQLLGVASFAGFAIIGLSFGFNHICSSRMFTHYFAFVKAKDVRMQAVTETFKAISVIKFNAWEEKAETRIDEARKTELKDIWGFLVYNGLSVVITWGLPVFISVFSFLVYVGVMKQSLTPAIVFTSIALFQLIQSPMRLLPHIASGLLKAVVAQKRINAFLAAAERDPENVHTVDHPTATSYIKRDIVVAVENGAFTWDANASPVIRDATLHVRVGDLVVVHGAVGTGKSSFCSALLGDVTKISGSVFVGGSVAYCSQQAWIQHMTVRDNILFGRPYDHEKYQRVLEACALTTDLASLPAGDRTEIGERGVNLSGGQKARVALARACYSDASVFILDSPLSAVDAIVQNEIFNKCILGLLRNRTVILVTHSPEIISSEYATRVVTINENGELVETRNGTSSRTENKPLVTPLPKLAIGRQDNYVTSNTEAWPSVTQSPRATNDKQDANETDKLVQDEGRAEGRVGRHVFATYYRAIGGFPVLAVVVISQILWQALQISSDFWLGDWSTDATSSTAPVSQSYRMTVYTILGLAAAAMVVMRTLVISWCGLNASQRLFERMTHALLHAPMKFFDATPVGRILLRYSSDTSDVDLMVPLGIGAFLANIFSVSCTVVITGVIIRWNGLLLLPIIVLYVLVGVFYLGPAREIERVLKTTQAPVLSHLSESIEGSAVIRAFGSDRVTRFRGINDDKLDTANKVRFAKLCVSRWFALRMQLLGSALVFIVAASLVLLREHLSAAIVGLAFSYVLKISQSVQAVVTTWSIVETTMVSPERLQQYVDVEQEAAYKIPSMDPPCSSEWPTKGAITVDKLSFRYKTSDRVVLKDLSFAINGGEKIGIVGRTGAGKSSLTMALFRINELAGGSITIDGVDSSKIGLKTLRENMSIIPQLPVLFKGPLRKYLDPFNEYADEALWNALRRIGLSDRISGEAEKLEVMVEDNGENFSVGERQMLCMTRALLKESRIVIFDEATASIDHETDQKLQRVIREAFASSTVLTIAHRLDTILDADRILVLDAGEIVAFDSPSVLVKQGSGHFYELMREGGYLAKVVQQS